jgi:hypothetical protein
MYAHEQLSFPSHPYFSSYFAVLEEFDSPTVIIHERIPVAHPSESRLFKPISGLVSLKLRHDCADKWMEMGKVELEFSTIHAKVIRYVRD